MNRIPLIFGPILLSYLVCLNAVIYGIETACPRAAKTPNDLSVSNCNSPLSLLGEIEFCNGCPIEGLIFPQYYSMHKWLSIDLEHVFIYMQRNWNHLLNEIPNVFAQPLSLFSDGIVRESNNDQSQNSIAVNPVIQGQDCAENCLTDGCCTLERICSTITLRHIDPGGIGYCHGYTTLEGLFFPFCSTCNIWPFIDLRLHWFNNNEWAGNIGVGSRFFNPCCNVAYGFNAYFDFRTSCHRNFFFPQVGIGLERLSACFDVRINGYFPFARTKTVKRCHFDYPGGFFIDRHKQQVALMGCDLEIGKALIQCCCFEFYGAIGPYFYGKAHCAKAFVGGRARAVMSFGRYFSLEGIASYDNRYKAKFQGSVAINIPFGCCPDGGICQDILSRAVRRNEIMVLDTFCTWKTNY